MLQTAALTGATPYAEDFAARRKERLAEPVWLVERRQAAIADFEAKGFPTRRDEAWRNLDLSALAKAHYPALHLPGQADAAALKAVLPQAHWLVFVDGHFSEAQSELAGLPKGVELRPLHHALERDETGISDYLSDAGNPFAGLNTAFFEDGALVRLARGVVLERPLAIAYLNSDRAASHAIYPRTLIVAEAGAQAAVAEFHQGADAAYLSCPVTEIHLGANAQLQYYRLQQEGAQALHFSRVCARLARDARLSGLSFAVGARTARTDLVVDLTAEGAEADFDGLYLTSEGQFLDHHTWVSHLAPHCNSRQRFKGVLNGRSEAVFDGLVKVAKGAVKTDARQENRNLLLTKRALAHSNPRLEIYNDDVKCSHGSTVGELDPDALFYLRSRGLGLEEAQGLLTYAFIGELIDSIRIEALREYVRRSAYARLPGGEGV